MDVTVWLSFPKKIYLSLSSYYCRQNTNERLKLWAALILSSILIFRVGVFAHKYAGVEHDSGWIMSVARSVADHGIFASMVDTSNGKAPGVLGNIHGRPSIMTEDFHTLFPYAVTVGPGYAIPQAILLKIFGTHFWSLRLWPQITMWILFFLSILFVLTYGGIYSGLLYSLFLYITPRFYVAHSFEAYAETIAILYSFIGLLIFHHRRVPFMRWIKKSKISHPIVAGIFLGFGVETKQIGRAHV